MANTYTMATWYDGMLVHKGIQINGKTAYEI